MPFPTERVGLRLAPLESTLTPRCILAYAAGLSASEPAFLDDARADGLVALPFQCVSPEWPVVQSVRDMLGDTLSPEEARRGVHAIQDSTFHRPMRPGDRLATEGQLVSATAIRAGVLTVCRLETRLQGSGEPVTTTWTSSIYRDVALSGPPVTLEEPPPTPRISRPGEDAVVERLHIPREMPHVYSECADIWNPIHTERRVALAAGLPDIILHGTATWALAGLTILRRHAGTDASRLRRITGRFSGMVIPGEDIFIRHAPGPEEGQVRFEVQTASGAVAISQGLAWLDAA
jgi:acyl dehydratase